MEIEKLFLPYLLLVESLEGEWIETHVSNVSIPKQQWTVDRKEDQSQVWRVLFPGSGTLDKIDPALMSCVKKSGIYLTEH